MTRTLLLLAGVTILASGCPGTASHTSRLRRQDGGVETDSYPGWPSNADPRAPFRPDSGAAQPDTTPACTPLEGGCGGGQPACCAGGHCVDFGQGGLCAQVCSGNTECSTGCCVATTQGVAVCGPAAYCPAAAPPPQEPPAQNPPPQEPPPQNPPPQNPPAASPTSCQGFCGGQAAGGCYCDYFCLIYGDCCPDVFICLF